MIASIIEKVVDGLLKSLPKIVEKLFGYGLFDLFHFNDQLDYQENYQGNYQSNYQNNYRNNYNSLYKPSTDIKKLFGHFGLVGYIPLFVLKIIDGITTLMNLLKRNKFVKNFLVPAGIVLLVAGSIVFLIWWLQPEYNENYEDKYQEFSKYYDHPQYHSKPINYYGNSYGNDFSYKEYDHQKMYDNYKPNPNDYHDKSYRDLPYKKFSSPQHFDSARNVYKRRGPYRSYFGY